MTIEQCLLEEAMTITDQAEADSWFMRIVEERLRRMPPGVPPAIMREAVEQTLRADLGYFAGYYSNETRERVERLFNCEHPYFGKISVNGPPTPEEVFRMGYELWRRGRE